MTKTIKNQNNILIFGLPLLIITIMVLIANSSLFNKVPNQLALGITLDLLLTSPLLYFLLIGKTKIPKTTVIPFIILGLVVGSFIIPTENQYYLNLFKTWILPLIEVFAISYIIYTARKVIKSYKAKEQTQTDDFYTIIKKSCESILPTFLVSPLATELSVIYYGIIYWKKRPIKSNEFTYHKISGSISLFLAFMLVIVAETIGIHYLLIQSEDVTGVWIISGLSIYTALQLFGFIKSILKRPFIITDTALILRYGIMKETTIALKNILAVEFTTSDLKKDSKTLKLSLLGSLESHNTILHLSEDSTLTGFYGFKKSFKSIALSVDEKEVFKMALKKAKNSALKNED